MALESLCNRRTFLCTTMTMSASICIASTLDSAEIPFRLGGNLKHAVVVPVTINWTGPFEMIIDTGASNTVFTSELARKIDLPNRGVEASSGIGGGQYRLFKTSVESMTIGNATARPDDALWGDSVTSDLMDPNLCGIVGFDFLKHFVVTIDYPRLRLRLDAR